MQVLVTGSSGHLGEALSHVLTREGHQVTGLDVRPGRYTTKLGSLTDRAFVSDCMAEAHVVYHTAALHKPHVATHRCQEFVDVNITGTLNLLEEAATAGVESFVFTSTTSVFGFALMPPPAAPAAWVTETTRPLPKNIYGITKLAAEDLCELFYRRHGLAGIILRTSRFFPEEDDDPAKREAYCDENLKANEFLIRRVDVEDVVTAHILAARRARDIGFAKYIVSATTPFSREDVQELRSDATAVVRRRVPSFESEYQRRGWRMFPTIDRVYDNERARAELGWRPIYDFSSLIARLQANQSIRSPLARLVGSKGYHDETFADGPYPIEQPAGVARPRAQ